MTDSVVIRKFLPRIEIRRGDKETAWKAGTNGQNGILGYWFWSDIEHRVGSAAQEDWEWHWTVRWKATFMVATLLVVGALAWFLDLPLWLAVVPALFASLGTQTHFMQRRKELMSHEVETQAVVEWEGLDAETYRDRQINPVAGGMKTYPWLKGMSSAEIDAGMRSYTPKAQAWVRRKADFLHEIHNFRWPS